MKDKPDNGAAEIKRLRLALADCEATLKTIHTWATFRSGEALRDRWSVAKRCKLVLDSLHNDQGMGRRGAAPTSSDG